jgi:putative Mn2+ efflux pump MntP
VSCRAQYRMEKGERSIQWPLAALVMAGMSGFVAALTGGLAAWGGGSTLAWVALSSGYLAFFLLVDRRL